MIKLILPILLSSSLQARESLPREIVGKVVQITQSSVTPCGQEYIVIIQTRTNFSFIYEYDINMANRMLKFVGKNAKVYYTDTIGENVECKSGVKRIVELK